MSIVFSIDKLNSEKNIIDCFEKNTIDSFNYKRELTNILPHAIEIIESIFDNAISLAEDSVFSNNKMCENFVYIYGGVVRDLLAGTDIQGDLDFLTIDMAQISHAFINDPKWTLYKNKKNQLNTLSIPGPIKTLRDNGAYLKSNSKPVFNSYNNVITTKFINFNGAKVDLIQPKDSIKDKVMNTDLLCCCFLMDLNGRIYELVEGAFDDCKSQILRINPNSNNLNKDRLCERIRKLERRGWVSKINLEEVKETEQLTTMSTHSKRMLESYNKLKVSKPDSRVIEGRGDGKVIKWTYDNTFLDTKTRKKAKISPGLFSERLHEDGGELCELKGDASLRLQEQDLPSFNNGFKLNNTFDGDVILNNYDFDGDVILNNYDIATTNCSSVGDGGDGGIVTEIASGSGESTTPESEGEM